jgi:hypothetical protein
MSAEINQLFNEMCSLQSDIFPILQLPNEVRLFKFQLPYFFVHLRLLAIVDIGRNLQASKLIRSSRRWAVLQKIFRN